MGISAFLFVDFEELDRVESVREIIILADATAIRAVFSLALGFERGISRPNPNVPLTPRASLRPIILHVASLQAPASLLANFISLVRPIGQNAAARRELRVGAQNACGDSSRATRHSGAAFLIFAIPILVISSMHIVRDRLLPRVRNVPHPRACVSDHIAEYRRHYDERCRCGKIERANHDTEVDHVRPENEFI